MIGSIPSGEVLTFRSVEDFFPIPRPFGTSEQGALDAIGLLSGGAMSLTQSAYSRWLSSGYRLSRWRRLQRG